MNAANRGKYAEGQVKAMLKKLEASDCAHHRFPDRRAGSFATAPADFMFLQSGLLRVLEVKEVDHEYLLPYKNFDPSQVARMRMWQAAGAKAWVVIYFTPAKFYRLLPVDYFLNRPLKTVTGRPIGSWNLSDFPFVTLKEAFGLV